MAGEMLPQLRRVMEQLVRASGKTLIEHLQLAH